MFWLRTVMALIGSVYLSVALAANPEATEATIALQAELKTLLKDRSLRGARVAVQVVDQSSGDEIFAYNANAEMTPASTMKVLTAAAALKRLGPSYRFKTEILTESEIDGLGVHKGDVYIRGGVTRHSLSRSFGSWCTI